MNIYKSLNEVTAYIDDHLEEDIDYEVLAKFLGINTYTFQKLFMLLSGYSLAEYIRKRRLSNAVFDLYKGNCKIIDLAIKYNYNNATSFSRAFKNFHGIKPSLVNSETKLKNFPRIVFDENISITTELDYEIVTLSQLDLYGISIKTNNKEIGHDAPIFFAKIEALYGLVKYGMITYDFGHKESQRYYCLYEQKIKNFEHIHIPESRWLKFTINSQESGDIQNVSHRFYREFLPSCKYNLKELPELEYYHDDITDFLVAIY